MPALALTPAAVLAAWEEGLALSPIERGLRLLAAAWPEFSAEDWAQASIGLRDHRLLTVRAALFGSLLEAATTCPQCGERIETSFELDSIRGPQAEAAEKVTVEAAGCEVECRLPTSADLLEVTQSSGDRRALLLERCLQSARNREGELSARELPPEVVSAITTALERADPQADVQVALACPACQHRWSMVFDILSWLWNEIDEWAQRLLREVHILARAYSWSEREIVELSPRRRRFYLDLIEA